MEEGASITISDPNSEFAAKYPNGLTLDDLLPFYEDVAQNKPIQLEWKFPGRIKRPSTQDLEAKKDEALASGGQQEKKLDEAETPETQQQQQQQLNFAEFDFDTETSVAAADTAALVASQRRPLGGSARPVRERRVARLDKILQEDMVRRRLEMEQLRQQQQRHQAEAQQVQSTETTSMVGKGEKEQSAAAETETTVSQPLPPSQESRPMKTNEGSAVSTDLPAQLRLLKPTKADENSAQGVHAARAAEVVVTALLAPTVVVDQGPLTATTNADVIRSEHTEVEVAVVLSALTVHDPTPDRVWIVGEKVKDLTFHICDICDKPIVVYGRLPHRETRRSLSLPPLLLFFTGALQSHPLHQPADWATPTRAQPMWCPRSGTCLCVCPSSARCPPLTAR
ncbi:hypothetical protein EGR_02576 [Echinococcus granulosus]|uniref:Uncharacterized protein n=2 Tax=Echinococcus granulosus TaxID=6210 RepID=W6V7L6_ECHGR|nr:hypothetical protein EGR_02576 [Echinococcus granulosus]EUB62444.1 hypothetical protein EGR_02576 [Echinococcus granulosus]